jgi:ADP-ribose pyrophosphatase
MKPRPWQTLSSRIILDLNPWFSVLEDSILLPSGRIVDNFYRIESPDYVLVTAINDEGSILFERHFKQCLERTILTAPAGGVEPNESPLNAAKRELLEETGYEAERWRYMGAFTVDGTRGICNAHIFLADGLRKTSAAQQDDMEEFEVLFLGRQEIRNAFRDKEIVLLPDVAILSMATSELFADMFEECVP